MKHLLVALVMVLPAATFAQVESLFGFSNGDGYPSAVAKISPYALGCGADGTIWVGDSLSYMLRTIGPDNITEPVLAHGSPYAGIAVAADGTVYASDPYRNVIQRIGGPHMPPVAPYAGGWVDPGSGGGGFGGDGGPALNAKLNSPLGLAVDGDGNLFIADSSNMRIRRVDAITKVITTVAGGGQLLADGVPATSARLAIPVGVDVDKTTGDIYVVESLGHRVRAVRRATGTISTVAGTGTAGTGGDGGPAILAQLTQPQDVAVAADGGLYIADTGGATVRHVRTDGTITVAAGVKGQHGTGNGKLDRPKSVEFCRGGLVIGEQGNANRGSFLPISVPPTPTAAPSTPTAVNTHTPTVAYTMTRTPTPAMTATRTITSTPTETCPAHCS